MAIYISTFRNTFSRELGVFNSTFTLIKKKITVVTNCKTCQRFSDTNQGACFLTFLTSGLETTFLFSHV